MACFCWPDGSGSSCFIWVEQPASPPVGLEPVSRWSRGLGPPFAWLLRGPASRVHREVVRRGGVPGCRPCLSARRGWPGWPFLLLASAALDVLFTWLAFRLGAVEANPVMAAVFARWGFAWGSVLKMALAFGGALFLPAAAPRSRLAGPGLVCCALVQALTAAWGFAVVVLLC